MWWFLVASTICNGNLPEQNQHNWCSKLVAHLQDKQQKQLSSRKYTLAWPNERGKSENHKLQLVCIIHPHTMSFLFEWYRQSESRGLCNQNSWAWTAAQIKGTSAKTVVVSADSTATSLTIITGQWHFYTFLKISPRNWGFIERNVCFHQRTQKILIFKTDLFLFKTI